MAYLFQTCDRQAFSYQLCSKLCLSSLIFDKLLMQTLLLPCLVCNTLKGIPEILNRTTYNLTSVSVSFCVLTVYLIHTLNINKSSSISSFPKIQFFDIGNVNNLTLFVGKASSLISKVNPFFSNTFKLSINICSFTPVSSSNCGLKLI